MYFRSVPFIVAAAAQCLSIFIMLYILIQLNVRQGEFYDGILSLDYCVFLGMILDEIKISHPYWPIVISTNNYYV